MKLPNEANYNGQEYGTAIVVGQEVMEKTWSNFD
jgi:hypothetical protein